MRKLGFNHIDLATKDMAATRAFYEGVLGFPAVRSDLIEREGGGRSEHVFFDCGAGQMIAFLYVPSFPEQLDTSLSHGLGVRQGIYHFAFEAGSLEGAFGDQGAARGQ